MTRVLLYSICAFFIGSGAAQAATVGYTLEISGSDNNVPTFRLTNDSDTDLITSFMMTIGNTAYNFDAAYNSILGLVGTATLQSPDGNSGGGVRDDEIHYTFTGFDSGDVFQFDGDVDLDSSDTLENYETVMFNNGGILNSEITVSFLSGIKLAGFLPDFNASDSVHTFSQRTNDTEPVPEPSTLLLLGTGLVGLIGYRRRTA